MARDALRIGGEVIDFVQGRRLGMRESISDLLISCFNSVPLSQAKAEYKTLQNRVMDARPSSG